MTHVTVTFANLSVLLNLRLRLKMKALTRVLVDLLSLSFAHVDSGMRLAHKVVLTFVAQLFKHNLLVFYQLSSLVLQCRGTSRASAPVENRIRRVQLSAVLLNAALIVGRTLLIIAPHLLLLQLLLLKNRQVLIFNNRGPVAVYIYLPVTLNMRPVGCVVLGAILFGRRSRSLIVA